MSLEYGVFLKRIAAKQGIKRLSGTRGNPLYTMAAEKKGLRRIKEDGAEKHKAGGNESKPPLP